MMAALKYFSQWTLVFIYLLMNVIVQIIGLSEILFFKFECKVLVFISFSSFYILLFLLLCICDWLWKRGSFTNFLWGETIRSDLQKGTVLLVGIDQSKYLRDMILRNQPSKSCEILWRFLIWRTPRCVNWPIGHWLEWVCLIRCRTKGLAFLLFYWNNMKWQWLLIWYVESSFISAP